MNLAKSLIALVLLAAAGGAVAQEKFILDQNGCKVINPAPRPEETVTWSGGCGPDGSVYRGGWKAGKPHGEGEYRTPEGRVMRGEWENGRFKGDPEADPNRT